MKLVNIFYVFAAFALFTAPAQAQDTYGYSRAEQVIDGSVDIARIGAGAALGIYNYRQLSPEERAQLSAIGGQVRTQERALESAEDRRAHFRSMLEPEVRNTRLAAARERLRIAQGVADDTAWQQTLQDMAKIANIAHAANSENRTVANAIIQNEVADALIETPHERALAQIDLAQDQIADLNNRPVGTAAARSAGLEEAGAAIRQAEAELRSQLEARGRILPTSRRIFRFLGYAGSAALFADTAGHIYRLSQAREGERPALSILSGSLDSVQRNLASPPRSPHREFYSPNPEPRLTGTFRAM